MTKVTTSDAIQTTTATGRRGLLRTTATLVGATLFGSGAYGEEKKQQQRTASKSALKVALCIPEYGGWSNTEHARSLYKTGQFYVTVTNISSKLVNIFATGNSWGSETLSLEFAEEDGTVHTIGRVPSPWFSNVFRTVRLQPGEAYVIDVRYDATGVTRPDFPAWQPFPFGERRAVTVRAIFEQNSTRLDKKFDIWTGKVMSEPLPVILD